MADAGIDILKQALGEQGYRDHIEEKRAEIEYWQTLSEQEQQDIFMQDNFDISPGDVYQIIDAGAARPRPGKP